MDKPIFTWKLYIMGTGRRGHIYALFEAETYKKALNQAAKTLPNLHTSLFRLER